MMVCHYCYLIAPNPFALLAVVTLYTMIPHSPDEDRVLTEDMMVYGKDLLLMPMCELCVYLYMCVCARECVCVSVCFCGCKIKERRGLLYMMHARERNCHV